MQNIKQSIREYILRRLNIPYNRYGIPTPLMKHLCEGEPVTVIDIGAHNGDFTEAIALYCGIKKAVLVEPMPQHYELLGKRFPAPEFKVINNAVSDVRGTSYFEVNKAKATSSLLRIKRDMPELQEVDAQLICRIECQTITLDDVFNAAELSSVDLIKIDVQGAEHLVIRGGEYALRRTKILWVEASFKPLYESSSTFMDIYDALYALGFKLMEISPCFQGPDGELLQADTLFERKGR